MALFALSAGQACAEQYKCAEDVADRSIWCFASSAVTAKGDVRAADVFTGGPKEIHPSGYTATVNCTLRTLELTDRRGVLLLGGPPRTQQGRDFVRYLCEHTPARGGK
jgi:hypothetical protein